MAGADKDAMLLGGKMHRKIQRRMGADYHAEVPLKIEIPCNGFTLVIDGRADGIIENASGIVIDEIKGVMRDLEQIEEPVSVHLAQAKCYAYIYATQKNLDEIGVQMTYCNLETEDIRRFQSVYAYEDLKRWFLDVAGQYEKWARYQVRWKQKRNTSIKKIEFPFVYREGQKNLAASVYRTIARKKKLFIQAPTGVGKTELSLRVAEHFGSPIISSDSRQLYKDLPIGTAAPTVEQMARVRHYMVGTLSLTDYYSASSFEEDVMSLLRELHQTHPTVVMTGGSMMYIDAVTKGIDDIPTVTPEIRTAIYKQFEEEGLSPILAELKETDPIHYNEVDRNNYKRVIHAVEICRMTGKPYSSFRTNTRKERPFRIIQIGLTRDREELYDRINRRVDQMMADGMLEEARRVYPFRKLNSLNTVGYKELFKYLDGEWTLDFAIEKIKRNSRVYARKQMTWFKRDTDIRWFHPDEKEAILCYLDATLNTRL